MIANYYVALFLATVVLKLSPYKATPENITSLLPSVLLRVCTSIFQHKLWSGKNFSLGGQTSWKIGLPDHNLIPEHFGTCVE